MDFQDSFQELTLIDANDWNNIPVPIMKAIAIMKKCIFSQMQIVNCNSDKITSFGKQYDSQLRFFDLEIKSLTKAVITNEDTNKKANKELSENLKKTTGSLQINLENEIGFLKKNSEGKLEYLEQQLEKSKKVLDNLPTSKDVDEKILGSLKQMSEKLRKEIKEDVKNTVTEPEFLKINSKISMIEPSIVAFQK